jgi:integrase
MANRRGRKRRFGTVRQLASRRFQARYRGPDGVLRPADTTFVTKTDAEVWLTRKEAEILDDDWIDPNAGAVLLSEYGSTWIDERPGLRPKTVTLYRYLLRTHITPHFRTATISAITLPAVRRWRKKLLDTGVSPVTAAKAYRLLRAVLNTAVDDGLIRRNPCRIKGAGTEDSPERPVLTVAEVFAPGRRDRPAIQGAPALGHLRQSPLGRTRRTSLARYRPRRLHRAGNPPDHLSARRSFVWASYCKSKAGRRVVPFPDLIVPELRDHLDALGQSATLAFTSPQGTPLRHSNFYRRAWMPALAAVGLSGVHFHDLRGTGNQLSADAGANLRELMERMGHDSTHAALIYLHSSANRQRAIADQIGKNAATALDPKRNRSGTYVARDRMGES